MDPRRLIRSPLLLSTISAAFVLLIWQSKGAEIGKWSVIGLLGTAGYLWGTWLGIRMAGRSGVDVRMGSFVLILVFLLKIPPIVLLALAARDASAPVRDGLLLGAAMVYSWLIAWGLLPEKDPARPSP